MSERMMIMYGTGRKLTIAGTVIGVVLLLVLVVILNKETLLYRYDEVAVGESITMVRFHRLSGDMQVYLEETEEWVDDDLLIEKEPEAVETDERTPIERLVPGGEGYQKKIDLHEDKVDELEKSVEDLP